MKKILLISLLMILFTFSHAEDKKVNCIIKVEVLRKSLEKETLFYKTWHKTKEDCKENAELHKIIFLPNVVKKKDVTFTWNEK